MVWQAGKMRSMYDVWTSATRDWVSMRPLAGVAEYRAHQFFENDSVGSHPSDAGMEKIASLILEVISGGDN